MSEELLGGDEIGPGVSLGGWWIRRGCDISIGMLHAKAKGVTVRKKPKGAPCERWSRLTVANIGRTSRNIEVRMLGR